MKYNQPYGISDPNAAYINGNPSTGTMGSIPPAQSIEYPQREVVNFITYSGLTPANADLAQLSKSVQSGRVNYATDAGAANFIIVNPSLALTAYTLGVRFLVKVAAQNTSFVTVNVSGLGPKNLIHCDGTPIQAWELRGGQLIEIAYDGTAFELIAGGIAAGPIFLTAPRDLYVNNTIGSDTLYDGTSAAISGTSGPFATMRKALSTMQKYNLAGWDFNIRVADGTYTDPNPIEFPLPNGSGTVNIVGNTGNPQACRQFNTGVGSVWIFNKGGNWTVSGFSFKSTSPRPGDTGSGIVIFPGSMITGALNFETLAGGGVFTGPGGGVLHGGPITTTAASMQFLLGAFGNGVNFNNSPTSPALNIINPCSFTVAFVSIGDGAQARPLFSTITGAGNANGLKFQVTGNGVVQTGGLGVSYLPGNLAGTVASGGQYL